MHKDKQPSSAPENVPASPNTESERSRANDETSPSSSTSFLTWDTADSAMVTSSATSEDTVHASESAPTSAMDVSQNILRDTIGSQDAVTIPLESAPFDPNPSIASGSVAGANDKAAGSVSAFLSPFPHNDWESYHLPRAQPQQSNQWPHLYTPQYQTHPNIDEHTLDKLIDTWLRQDDSASVSENVMASMMSEFSHSDTQAGTVNPFKFADQAHSTSLAAMTIPGYFNPSDHSSSLTGTHNRIGMALDETLPLSFSNTDFHEKQKSRSTPVARALATTPSQHASKDTQWEQTSHFQTQTSAPAVQSKVRDAFQMPSWQPTQVPQAQSFSSHESPQAMSNASNAGSSASHTGSDRQMVSFWDRSLIAHHARQPKRAPTSQVRTVLDADTWQVDISDYHDPHTPNNKVASPAVAAMEGGAEQQGETQQDLEEGHSPDQIASELRFDYQDIPRYNTVSLPSMTFLDSCLHLYFRDFHPSFPILHRPSFDRNRIAPLLLLSMCSIGCMFVGSKDARDMGISLYLRVHQVVVVTRDAKMATEKARITATLSSVLGQSFSLLSGQPSHLFTAETCHGGVTSFARRTGMFRLKRKHPPSALSVAKLDDAALTRAWRDWAETETWYRVHYGLIVHAAELAAYSSLPQVIQLQAKSRDPIHDALFEAPDASTWRSILLSHHQNGLASELQSTTPSITSDPTIASLPKYCRNFTSFVSLAQTFNNILLSRTLLEAGQETSRIDWSVPAFYQHMEQLVNVPQLLQMRTAESQLQQSYILWHYCCIVNLAPMDLIEQCAGREGSAPSDALGELSIWVNSYEARLCNLHCSHIFQSAVNLDNLGFLVPRAIFHATLVLIACIKYARISESGLSCFDMTYTECDWHKLAELGERSKNLPLTGSPSETLSPVEHFVLHGSNSVRLVPFFDGRERQLDVVSLISINARALRRCTSWGIGEALGEVLSNVQF